MSISLVDIDERLDEISYYRQMDPEGWKDFCEKINMCWIYHENVLDGTPLDTDDIRRALASDITPGISQISVYRRIRNFRNAINLIMERSQAENPVFDIELMRELHRILANGLDTGLGRYRRNSPVHRAYYQDICAPGQIEKRLNAIVALMRAEQQHPTMHPLELAGRVHYLFMEAYPFSSWSGVVGRFFINMYLMSQGFLPMVIHSLERQKYYHAVASNPALMTRMFLDAYENSLDNAYHHFIEPRQLLAQA